MIAAASRSYQLCSLFFLDNRISFLNFITVESNKDKLASGAGFLF
jgi:hypothetical protein